MGRPVESLFRHLKSGRSMLLKTHNSTQREQDEPTVMQAVVATNSNLQTHRIFSMASVKRLCSISMALTDKRNTPPRNTCRQFASLHLQWCLLSIHWPSVLGMLRTNFPLARNATKLSSNCNVRTIANLPPYLDLEWWWNNNSDGRVDANPEPKSYGEASYQNTHHALPAIYYF